MQITPEINFTLLRDRSFHIKTITTLLYCITLIASNCSDSSDEKVSSMNSFYTAVKNHSMYGDQNYTDLETLSAHISINLHTSFQGVRIKIEGNKEKPI